MPSPFPGMDPYLEGVHWTGFHATFGIEIVRQLAPRLRPHYVALPVERMVLDMVDGLSVTTTNIYPDVSVVEWPGSEAAATGTAIAAAPLQLATVIPTPIPHITIEIRDTAARQLVTSIEILSPANKRGTGRDEYLTKRQRLLLSTVHLLEIDLLHLGQRVPMQQLLPPIPYFVLLSRAERRPMTDVWPISLNQPLPKVPIPLLPDDAEVYLDLQQAFDAAYDLVGYDLILDYSKPPDVSLNEETATWIDQWLRTKGQRG